jgi:ABC-type glutathione transport system ATPase component
MLEDSSVVPPGQRQPGYYGPVKIGLHPGAMAQIEKLLDVTGLSVAFATGRGAATVVRGLDLHVAEGETLAVVGESGSGKSVTALSITRLIDHTGGHISAGRILFTDRTGRQRDLVAEPQEAMRQLRGPEMAMVFQEPMSSLNPVLRIGDQIAEGVMLHQGLGQAAVLVMRDGEKVEEGDAVRVFDAPQHPYTRTLLNAVPVLGSLGDEMLPLPFPEDGRVVKPQATVRIDLPPVLEVAKLTTRFEIRRRFRTTLRVHAVEQVSLTVRHGETLALVGESGCGKSTTGRSIIRLERPEAGEIRLNAVDITRLDREREEQLRRGVQYVFQDPLASLDPRLTIGFSIAEPIRTHRLLRGEAVERRVHELLRLVGLLPEHARRYPHELSGGQRQRCCIARALASEPSLIIADEAVAALDVSIRAQVVNLLMQLQARLGIAYLFISHDMAVVERVSHRVAVMYLGQIVEIGPRQAVFRNPQHPYTRRLLAAVPIPDPRRRDHSIALDDSEVPSPLRRLDDPPIVAPLVQVGEHHFVARHRVGGLY